MAALVVSSRVMRGPRPAYPRIGFASLLALWMVTGHVSVALSQAASSNVWSIQLHGGAFAPIEANGSSPMIGMRYAKHYSPHLYGGLLTGLASVSRSLEQSTQMPPNVGPRAELARVDARLVPLMGFLQVNFTEKSWLMPLLGIGAGYEWLAVEANDFRTGSKSTSTYGNFAWETYGGVAVRLRSKMRLSGEVYYNGGSLQRVVFDEFGSRWIEAVHVNGVGARVGLDMDFE